MTRLMIWDIDGTILDCRGCGRKGLSLTFERLYGYEDAFDEVDLVGKIDIEVIDEVVRHHAIPDFDLIRFLEAYRKTLEEVMAATEGIGLLPGVRDVLNHFSGQKDYYLCIATGNCKAGAEGKLRHVDAEGYFPIGAYGDQARDRATLIAQAIENAQNHFGQTFQRDEIFYLGDTPKDIEAARTNGIHSVAVSTGLYPSEKLKAHHPDHLLTDMRDFARVSAIFK